MNIKSLLLTSAFAGAVAANAQVIPGHYIVELAPDANAKGLVRAFSIEPTFVYDAAVNGFAATLNDAQVQALRNNPNVLSISPDNVIEIVQTAVDPTLSEPISTQIVPGGVTRIGAAPGVLPVTGAGVGVAILDTGLDFNHTDLAANISPSSYSAVSATAQDDQGHGTHVGGIVAAVNNLEGIVGVAPNATLYAVKVLDAEGSGSDSQIIAGLNWVANNAKVLAPNIKVVNMSLGRRGSVTDNPAMRKAVQTLTSSGVAVIVAAGNDPATQATQQVPACYPEVLAIASTTAENGVSATGYPVIQADTASFFTTDGAYKNYRVFGKMYLSGVTISAPGGTREDVTAAGYIEEVGITSLSVGGGLVGMSGTSMAAPHAAGVAALLFEQKPALSAEQVRASFRAAPSRKAVAPLNSPTRSYTFDGEREGVLDAKSALEASLQH